MQPSYRTLCELWETEANQYMEIKHCLYTHIKKIDKKWQRLFISIIKTF